MILASLGAFDQLAYDSIYPKLIPEGMEEKGYAVSSMLYPVIRVAMTPVAALLFEKVGVGLILLLQAGLSIAAALTENCIRITEEKEETESYTFKLWWEDVTETVRYLKQEKGLRSIFSYMIITNGVASGYSPLLIAGFRTIPGLTAAMYSLFSVAEFLGRSIGGTVRYTTEMPKEKKFGFTFGVYMFYETMDMILLWIPYPFMLLNRAVTGFLGINSANMREAAVQRYLPDRIRSRIYAYQSVTITIMSAVFTLILGALGEIMDYRMCVTVGAAVTLIACLLTIFRNRVEVRKIYEAE